MGSHGLSYLFTPVQYVSRNLILLQKRLDSAVIEFSLLQPDYQEKEYAFGHYFYTQLHYTHTIIYIIFANIYGYIPHDVRRVIETERELPCV